MAKYHINPQTGNPNICRAQKGQCPYGDSSQHYSTKDAARVAYEESQSPADLFARFSSLSSQNKEKFLDLLETEGLQNQPMADPSPRAQQLLSQVEKSQPVQSDQAMPRLRAGWPISFIAMEGEDEKERMKEWKKDSSRMPAPGSRMPVPWINTSRVHQDRDWLGFDDEAMLQLETANYELCAICGEQLGEDKIFGVLGQGGMPSDHPRREELYRTTGSGMHPRCALLALKYCPHLQGKDDEPQLESPFVMVGEEGNGFDPSSLSQSEGDISEILVSGGARQIEVDEIRALAQNQKISGKA